MKLYRLNPPPIGTSASESPADVVGELISEPPALVQLDDSHSLIERLETLVHAATTLFRDGNFLIVCDEQDDIELEKLSAAATHQKRVKDGVRMLLELFHSEYHSQYAPNTVTKVFASPLQSLPLRIPPGNVFVTAFYFSVCTLFPAAGFELRLPVND